jgi:hypothetical protein
MEIAALIILILSSLIGFAAIFFTTFGTLIIMIGAVVYTLMTGFTVLKLDTIIALLTLYLCGEVFEYLFIILGAKKFGASNAAVGGAIVGGILGALIGSLSLGIGLIMGTFLGIFLGAFIVEYILLKDTMRSLKAAAGSVLGRVAAIAAKVVIACAMLAIMIINILRQNP